MSVEDIRRTLVRIQNRIDHLRLTKFEREELEETLVILAKLIIQRENSVAQALEAERGEGEEADGGKEEEKGWEKPS